MQFNAVAACVVSTVLKHRQIRPHARARVIQRWIDIAQVSNILLWHMSRWNYERVFICASSLTGVQNTKELLISASNCLGAAVQPFVQTEEGLGLCQQVRYTFVLLMLCASSYFLN